MQNEKIDLDDIFTSKFSIMQEFANNFVNDKILALSFVSTAFSRLKDKAKLIDPNNVDSFLYISIKNSVLWHQIKLKSDAIES